VTVGVGRSRRPVITRPMFLPRLSAPGFIHDHAGSSRLARQSLRVNPLLRMSRAASNSTPSLEEMAAQNNPPSSIWADGQQFILVLAPEGGLKYIRVNEKDQVVQGFDLAPFLPKATWRDLGDVEDEHLCTICLEELEDGDLISPLRCKHQFHHKCIASWLTSRVMGGFIGCCPNCNHQVCSPVFEARTTSDDLNPATANSRRLEQLALTLPPRPRGTALPPAPTSRHQDIVRPVHSANDRTQARLSTATVRTATASTAAVTSLPAVVAMVQEAAPKKPRKSFFSRYFRSMRIHR